jgi:hypothetical protein
LHLSNYFHNFMSQTIFTRNCFHDNTSFTCQTIFTHVKLLSHKQPIFPWNYFHNNIIFKCQTIFTTTLFSCPKLFSPVKLFSQ